MWMVFSAGFIQLRSRLCTGLVCSPQWSVRAWCSALRMSCCWYPKWRSQCYLWSGHLIRMPSTGCLSLEVFLARPARRRSQGKPITEGLHVPSGLKHPQLSWEEQEDVAGDKGIWTTLACFHWVLGYETSRWIFFFFFPLFYATDAFL